METDSWLPQDEGASHWRGSRTQHEVANYAPSLDVGVFGSGDNLRGFRIRLRGRDFRWSGEDPVRRVPGGLRDQPGRPLREDDLNRAGRAFRSRDV